ncbi:MAG: hypothetical protein JO211_15580 [Acidobacteriaceae bacterium]|nr:hypothetical protein [Acidobacteriaceae bacterium]MBV9406767.1 hypothetical protein [Acidobacteriaceae bacterium]
MKRTMVLLPLLFALGTPAGAAMKPTPEMRRYCGPDSRKLCASVINNTAKRQACMRAHWKDVSEECKKAVAEARKKS